jgi:hypothetical protein
MDGSIGAGFTGSESTGTMDARGASFQTVSELAAPPPCVLPPAKTRAGRSKAMMLKIQINGFFFIKILQIKH